MASMKNANRDSPIASIVCMLLISLTKRTCVCTEDCHWNWIFGSEGWSDSDQRISCTFGVDVVAEFLDQKDLDRSGRLVQVLLKTKISHDILCVKLWSRVIIK
ncbi:unnamed protein product, partial [Eruca vesicaria subsp. sativa]|nr:unnamed protein product [Eruca vesicaria subsp. sativa]